MTGRQNSSDDDQITVDRARLDSVTVYDVTEEELEIIEQGSPSSLYLNLAITFITVCISFIVTLSTVDISSDRKFVVFVMVAIMTGIAGVILLAVWFKTHKSSAKIFTKIRARKIQAGSETAAAAVAEQAELNNVIQISTTTTTTRNEQ